METLINFFENLKPEYKLGWVVFCLSLAFIIESIRPLFKKGFRTWKHTRTNLIFLTALMLINTGVGLATVGLFNWMELEEWGLLRMFDLPIWSELLISLLVFDLIAQYTAHYVVHNVKFLWRIHLVHHSDTHVDATTGTRLHPLDFISRETFAMLAVFILGAPLGFYIFYRIVTVAYTYFNHANLNLPLAVDKAISWVFISPNVHKVHHHFEEPWTDRNYGNIFSIWDRVFGTFEYGDISKVQYGLDVTDDSKSDDLGYQMMLPFKNNGREKIPY